MVPENVTVKELLLEIIRRVEEKIDDVQGRVDAQLTQHGATIDILSQNVTKLISAVEKYDICFTNTIPSHEKRIRRLEQFKFRVAVIVGVIVAIFAVVGKTILKRMFGMEV